MQVLFAFRGFRGDQHEIQHDVDSSFEHRTQRVDGFLAAHLLVWTVVVARHFGNKFHVVVGRLQGQNGLTIGPLTFTLLHRNRKALSILHVWSTVFTDESRKARTAIRLALRIHRRSQNPSFEAGIT